jgi:hypothetical protein
MTINAQNRIKYIKEKLTPENLAKVAYPTFLKSTPIDTGNARKHTSVVGNELRAEYPYALRLNRGWSNQAPNGMVKPTMEYIRKYINSIIGK